MDQNISKRIITLLENRLQLLGIESTDVAHDVSLFDQGIVDSISFMELIVSIEDEFEVELDFSDMEPPEFDSIESLSKIISDER
ncbi:MAG: acyl carrier protein [Balneolaceae bacterium]|nr:MAG: acyl carrier protein [Balneolaceae bacterium]